MTTIVTRAGKGSPLTNTEVDTNFSNLNSAKLELGQSQLAANANSVLFFNGSKVVSSGTSLTFDGSTLAAPAISSAGAITQGGNQVLHAGNYANYRQDRIVDVGGSYLLLSNGNEIEFFNSAGVLQDMYLQYSGGVNSLRGPGGNIVLHAGNYNSYSPSLTGAGASGTWSIGITGNAATVTSITSSQVTTALGFTPYNSTNPSGFITSSAVAAGYQPLDADLTSIASLAGTSGFLKKTAANTWALDTNTYLTGITSAQVTTALGYTPYNSTNPSGYITSSASITGSSNRIAFLDTRATDDQPQGKTGNALSADFKSNTSVSSPPVTASGSYSHILTVAGWDTAGGSGGWPSQLSIGDGIAVRQATSATAWGPWRNVLHSNNFGSYALPISGGNLTGSLGLGVASPADKIDIGGSGNLGLRISNSNNTATDYAALRFWQAGVERGVIYTNGGNFVFSTPGVLAVGAGGAERYRVDTIGNFGIGTSSPATRLHVVGGSTTEVRVVSSGDLTTGSASLVRFGGSNSATSGYVGYGGVANALELYNGLSGPVIVSVGGVERFRVDNNGHFIQASASHFYSFATYNNTTGNAANVHIASDGHLFRSTSSLKYKTDVRDAKHGLKELLTLRSVTYKGKGDGALVFGGLIAEEVHAAGLTEFVQYAEDGTPDALAYGNMVSLCVKAIQELHALLEAALNRISILETISR